MAAATTASGLQSLLTKVATAEPNAPQGTRANRSVPVELSGSIQLTSPLTIWGNTSLSGTGNGATITYLGTDSPIVFSSAVGNGYTANVRLQNLTIYAPNAKYGWQWANHPGNASSYRFERMQITVAGVHLNCNAPGDGRFYSCVFDDIDCYGTGKIVEGSPITGQFNNVRVVSKKLVGPAIDIHDCTATFTNCWIEPAATQIFRMTGQFCLARWFGNHNEIDPSATPFSGSHFVIDGAFCRLLADSIFFTSPVLPVEVKNGAILDFMGMPSYSRADGVNPDPTQIDMDLLRKSYLVSGAGSVVRWSGGQLAA